MWMVEGKRTQHAKPFWGPDGRAFIRLCRAAAACSSMGYPGLLVVKLVTLALQGQDKAIPYCIRPHCGKERQG
jgi:hypothetical protein